MFTYQNGQKREVEPLKGGMPWLDSAVDFANNFNLVSRRVSYLAWVYQEMSEAFPDPLRGPDTAARIVGLGVIILDIISEDRARLEEQSEEAEALLRVSRKQQQPRFESVADVERAFELLRREKIREAGDMPLDESGRPIP